MSEMRLSEKQAKAMAILSNGNKISYLGFGGSKGGGKSHVSRLWLYARAKKYPKSTGLLIRKTYQELYRNHTKRFISDFPDVKYIEKKNHILFPNGSIIDLAYCETERDLERFQGAEYQSVVIDQAEQHKKEAFDLIRSCVRSTNKNIRPKMLLTFNPGGIGHTWLKRMFIQRSFEPGDPDPDAVDFLPAKVYDNRWIMDNDPDYVKRLESLPQQMREAYLNGSFDVFEGQFFSLSAESVEQPWEIPESSASKRLYGGLDHGINHPTCFILAYLDDKGNIHQLFTYLNNGATAYDHAKEILDRIKAFIYTHGQMPVKIFYDPSMNAKSSLHPDMVTSSIDQYREIFPKNVIFEGANNNKVHGCQLLKTILAGTHAYPRFKYWPQYNMSFEDGIKSVIVDKNNREVYLKMDGDDVADCFAGETLVQTGDGLKRIDSLVGKPHYVKTTHGYVYNEEGAHYIRDKELIRLTFEDGTSFRCTKDHKILTNFGQWVDAIDFLDSYGYFVADTYSNFSREYDLCESRKSLKNVKNLMGSSITSVANISKNAIKTVEKQECFTETFGNIIMERLKIDCMSITETEMSLITGYQIWRFLQNLSTLHYICQNQNVSHYQERASRKQENMLLNGTNPRQVESGTKNTGKNILARSLMSLLLSSAEYADAIMRFQNYFRKNQNIVTPIAKPQRCVDVEGAKSTEGVFCLKLNAPHNFAIENGLIVHNCTRYLTCGMYAEWNTKKLGLINRAHAASRIKTLQEKTWQEL